MTRNRIRRIVIVSCLALVAGQVVVLWRATGQGVLTRYFDPNRAALERASHDIAAIFKDDSDRFLEDAPNRFRLGLLPAGEDEHAVPVVTLLTPLLLAQLRHEPRILGHDLLIGEILTRQPSFDAQIEHTLRFEQAILEFVGFTRLCACQVLLRWQRSTCGISEPSGGQMWNRSL